MGKSFLNSLVFYGGSAGIARILPLLVLPVFLSKLGAEEFGRIEVLFAFFNLVIIFGLAQLESSFQRFFYSTESLSNLYSTVTLMIASLSLVSAIIIISLSSQVSSILFGSVDESSSIILCAITILFANLSTINLIYLRFIDSKITFAISNISQVVVSVLLGYIFIINHDMGSFGYFLGIFLGWVVCFMITSAYLLFKVKVDFKLKLENVKELFDFSLPQFPARIASFVFQYGNKFITLAILGTYAVANLSLAAKFAAPFQFMMLALSMVWNPFLYKNEHDKNLNGKINSLISYLIFSVVIIHIIVVILAKYVISNYFGSEFHDSAYYVTLAIIPFEMLAMKEIFESGIKLSKKTKYITYSYVISSAVMIPLMLISTNMFYMLVASIVGTFGMIASTWYYSTSTSSVVINKSAFFLYTLFVLANVVYCYLNIV
ncbi:lipopolysaccharide biosynthesis protein [Vibrio parahaemolyticus]|nr:lipopolysaccharide biosynthesis protein [Vibrio parahaemolyticus]